MLTQETLSYTYARKTAIEITQNIREMIVGGFENRFVILPMMTIISQLLRYLELRSVVNVSSRECQPLAQNNDPLVQMIVAFLR